MHKCFARGPHASELSRRDKFVLFGCSWPNSNLDRAIYPVPKPFPSPRWAVRGVVGQSSDLVYPLISVVAEFVEREVWAYAISAVEGGLKMWP